MESEHETSLKAVKQFLHGLGFDKNKAEESIHLNRSNIKTAMAKINSYLYLFPSCFIVKQCKGQFISYLKKQNRKVPNPHSRVAVIPSGIGRDGPIERSLARAIGPIHSVSQDCVTPVFKQAYNDDAMNLEDERSDSLQSSPHVRSTSSDRATSYQPYRSAWW